VPHSNNRRLNISFKCKTRLEVIDTVSNRAARHSVKQHCYYSEGRIFSLLCWVLWRHKLYRVIYYSRKMFYSIGYLIPQLLEVFLWSFIAKWCLVVVFSHNFGCNTNPGPKVSLKKWMLKTPSNTCWLYNEHITIIWWLSWGMPVPQMFSKTWLWEHNWQL